MLDSTWTQILAAVSAAVIPIVVKLLNDWNDKLQTTKHAKPEPAKN